MKRTSQKSEKAPLVTIEEVLNRSNLNWEVSKKEVLFDNGNSIVQFPSKAVIVRNDTLEPMEVLGKNYSIMQNSRLVEIAMEVAGSRNLEISKGGFMENGKLVFVQLDFKKNVRIGSDSVGRYITLINSHDGSCSFRIGFGNEVASCANQFNYFSKKSNMNFRHSSGLHESVDKVLKQLDFIREEETFLIDNFKKFETVSVDDNPNLINSMIKRVMNVDLSLPKEEIDKLYSSRKMNTVSEILACIDSEMSSKGRTLWGVFNGITYYANHVQCAEKPDKIDYSLKFGTGYDLNKSAYLFASHLVN